MRTLLLALALLGAISTTVSAATKLTDGQMGELAAGFWHGPVPVVPPLSPPGSPPINPGGPILITCTVGVGCTIRHYH